MSRLLKRTIIIISFLRHVENGKISRERERESEKKKSRERKGERDIERDRGSESFQYRKFIRLPKLK